MTKSKLLMGAVVVAAVGLTYLLTSMGGSDLKASIFDNTITGTTITANAFLKSLGNAEVVSNLTVRGMADIKTLAARSDATFDSNVNINGVVTAGRGLNAQTLKVGGKIIDPNVLVTTTSLPAAVSAEIQKLDLSKYINLTAYATKVYVDNAINTLKTYIDTADVNVKGYADGLIAAAKSELNGRIDGITTPSIFDGTITFNGDIVASSNAHGTKTPISPVDQGVTSTDGTEKTMTLACPSGSYLITLAFTQDVNSGEIKRISGGTCAKL